MDFVMGELNPMPSDEQIALWREHLTSSMTVAVSACLGVLQHFVSGKLPARRGESHAMPNQ